MIYVLVYLITRALLLTGTLAIAWAITGSDWGLFWRLVVAFIFYDAVTFRKH